MLLLMRRCYRKKELQAWPAFKPHHPYSFALLLLAGILDSKRWMAEAIRLVHSWVWNNPIHQSLKKTLDKE